MASRTLPRPATGNAITLLQIGYAALLLLVVAAPFIAASFEVEPSQAPAWLPMVIVLAVGAFSIFTVLFQRIRPVAPGSVRGYRKVIARRVWYSVIPALVGIILYAVSGHWSAVLLGAIATLACIAFAFPSQDDFMRHQEIWNERLPVPPTKVWGTADPDDIPPWEDPDGGHGHGYGTHGLH
jgi:hypothetical protein